MASAENERLAKEAGVKQVALPHVGKAPPERRAEEKGRRFREAYRFRAGIEGRIHALRRDYGLKRCRYHGERGMGRWVGWGDRGPQPGEGRGSGAGGEVRGAEGGDWSDPAEDQQDRQRKSCRGNDLYFAPQTSTTVSLRPQLILESWHDLR